MATGFCVVCTGDCVRCVVVVGARDVVGSGVVNRAGSGRVLVLG